MSEKKTLVITGGSKGIGRQVALSAMDDGWQVAISYKSNRDEAEHFVALSDGHAKAYPLDVGDAESIKTFFAAIVASQGVPKGLVTAAGVDLGAKPVAELDPQFVATTMTVNVTGLILCCQQFVHHLRAHGGGGTIVNISSMASTIGGRGGKTVYAASKGAVDVFTIGMAKELAAEGIAVFGVRPGVTRTDMTADLLAEPARAAGIAASIACGQVAEPEDIAKPVVDLLSGRFDYASGSLLNLGGGGFVV